jgi:hypothetical protein
MLHRYSQWSIPEGLEKKNFFIFLSWATKFLFVWKISLDNCILDACTCIIYVSMDFIPTSLGRYTVSENCENTQALGAGNPCGGS